MHLVALDGYRLALSCVPTHPGPSACCSGSGLVLHAAVLGRCWLVRRYLTLVQRDGSEDLEGVAGTQAYACAAARSRLVKPGQCGNVLFQKRAVLSKQVGGRCAAADVCGGGREKGAARTQVQALKAMGLFIAGRLAAGLV